MRADFAGLRRRCRRSRPAGAQGGAPRAAASL